MDKTRRLSTAERKLIERIQKGAIDVVRVTEFLRKKSKAGRKPLPESERRSKMIYVRLSAKELELIQTLARARGLSVSELLRVSVLEESTS